MVGRLLPASAVYWVVLLITSLWQFGSGYLNRDGALNPNCALVAFTPPYGWTEPSSTRLDWLAGGGPWKGRLRALDYY